jgi:hypothetical protein
MPSKRAAKSQDVHTQLAIRVEDYEAHIDAGINHVVFGPQYAWRLDDRDPLYLFTTRLVISGTATYPAERAGDRYDLTIHGDDAPSQDVHLTLKDAQKRHKKYGHPQYREYKGRQLPIYEPPSGFGLIEKIRGEKRWTAWIHAPTRFTNELLTLLGHKRQLFLSLRERKKDRARWVQGISLQTTDPMAE